MIEENRVKYQLSVLLPLINLSDTQATCHSSGSFGGLVRARLNMEMKWCVNV